MAALELMRGIVRRASSGIYEASFHKPELRGMGTTLTAVLMHSGKAHLVHAGDSRCYMFRDGQLRQLTEDHSWIAEQMKNGSMSEAEAKQSKFRHVITKSIGFERDIDADLKSVPVSAGDCFLLCSDGMSNYVEHGELERIVAMTWYRRLPEKLIELANDRGGDDNITVVVGLVANAPLD
jgi:serine/threonine protein phosphatase PrpC